jgi:hypothetical protein
MVPVALEAMDALKSFAQKFRSARSRSAPPWRNPVILDRGLLGVANLALDGKGCGMALWENAGRLWSVPIGPQSRPAIVRLPMGDGSNPLIVLNDDGRGLALWQAEAKAERQILGRILGGEDEASRVIFRTEGHIHHLQATVDRRGNALVVWLLEGDPRTEVLAQSFDIRALTWEQAPVILGLPSTPKVEPRIAANQREHAMVLWEADTSTEGLVASHFWPADRIWSDRPVPVVAHLTHHHRVAMDDQGNALAIWVHAPYGQRSSVEACYYDGRRCEWGDAEVIGTAKTMVAPRLVMSGAGDALAAWCQVEAHGSSHLISRAWRNGRWDPTGECHEPSHGPVKDFAMDLGPEGQAGLLMVQQGLEGDRVSVRLRKQKWSDSLPLVSASKLPCSSPRLRLCPNGASAMWFQGMGTERALVLAETN